MPLDNPRENPHQRLMDLEDILRDGNFPFKWDYRNCEGCALAIDKAHGLQCWDDIGNYYGITGDQALDIFALTRRKLSNDMKDVTAEDVANQIHKVLEKVLA